MTNLKRAKVKGPSLKRADDLFSAWIRAYGVCWAQGYRDCAGRLQCAHIFSRRYRALRWREENARCLCAGHHLYFTHRPAEWEQFCRDRGVDWDGLRHRALNDPPEKLADAIARMTGKAA